MREREIKRKKVSSNVHCLHSYRQLCCGEFESTRKQRLFVYFEEGQINKTFVVHIKLYFIKTTKKHTTRYKLSDMNLK